jgi:hypothetical protein
LFFFPVGTIFLSHNKSANSVFQPAYQHSRTAPSWIRSKGIQGTLERACCTAGHLVVCRGLNMWRKYRALYHFFLPDVIMSERCSSVFLAFWISYNQLINWEIWNLLSEVLIPNVVLLWPDFDWGEWPGFGYLRSSWWLCNVEFLLFFCRQGNHCLCYIWEQSKV